MRPGRGGIKLSAAKEQLEKLATCHELPRIILEQRRLAGALAKTVAPLLAVCRQHPKVGLPFSAVLRIRIPMILDLLDPDLYPVFRVAAPDPDPLSSSKNSKKNLGSYCFVT